jgi:lysophospholipase L1-like esterase
VTASGGSGQSGSSAAGGFGSTGVSGGASAGGQPQGGIGADAGSGGASASGGGPASGGSAGTGSTHTGVWRIMPLGDSITQTTCYPQLLSKKLKDSGHTNFELVGSSTNNQSCNGAPNVKSEGHGGYILGCLTGDYTSNCASKGTPTELSAWLSAMPAPDVALVHFGTNDVWNNIPTSTITTSYTHLLTSLRAANPTLIVFIAQILPMHPDNCLDGASNCPNNGVKMLNDAIPAWASGASTATSPVYVVDAYNSMGDPAAFVPNSPNTSDGVHPNATGSDVIADAWITSLLSHDIPD